MALSPLPFATLKIAIDRIVPGDDFSSASEAGVLDFFSRLFATEAGLEELYAAGLVSLEAESAARYGCGLTGLSDAEADALLTRVSDGDVKAEWPISPKEFFRLLSEQTIEGYYADPGNGGNRDEIAWRMVGFEVTA